MSPGVRQQQPRSAEPRGDANGQGRGSAAPPSPMRRVRFQVWSASSNRASDLGLHKNNLRRLVLPPPSPPEAGGGQGGAGTPCVPPAWSWTLIWYAVAEKARRWPASWQARGLPRPPTGGQPQGSQDGLVQLCRTGLFLVHDLKWGLLAGWHWQDQSWELVHVYATRPLTITVCCPGVTKSQGWLVRCPCSVRRPQN